MNYYCQNCGEWAKSWAACDICKEFICKECAKYAIIHYDLEMFDDVWKIDVLACESCQSTLPQTLNATLVRK